MKISYALRQLQVVAMLLDDILTKGLRLSPYIGRDQESCVYCDGSTESVSKTLWETVASIVDSPCHECLSIVSDSGVEESKGVSPAARISSRTLRWHIMCSRLLHPSSRSAHPSSDCNIRIRCACIAKKRDAATAVEGHAVIVVLTPRLWLSHHAVVARSYPMANPKAPKKTVPTLLVG